MMTDDEVDSLSVGSVIRCGRRGTLRVVRGLYRRDGHRRKRAPEGHVYNVLAAKRKCSRYPCPAAWIDRWYLKNHCEVTGARVRLDGPMDKAFERDLGRMGDPKSYELTCDIVKDLPA